MIIQFGDIITIFLNLFKRLLHNTLILSTLIPPDYIPNLIHNYNIDKLILQFR